MYRAHRLGYLLQGWQQPKQALKSSSNKEFRNKIISPWKGAKFMCKLSNSSISINLYLGVRFIEGHWFIREHTTIFITEDFHLRYTRTLSFLVQKRFRKILKKELTKWNGYDKVESVSYIDQTMSLTMKKKKRASASYIKAWWGNEAYATHK